MNNNTGNGHFLRNQKSGKIRLEGIKLSSKWNARKQDSRTIIVLTLCGEINTKNNNLFYYIFSIT